jgi:protein SCO1
LIDPQQRIRGQYDGTKPEEVDRLIKDIQRLKREKK